MYGWYLAMLDRPEGAIAEARRALEINPLSARSYSRLGWVYYFARRYDDTIAQYQKVIQMDANASWAHFYIAWAYREKGMYKEAIAEFLNRKQTDQVSVPFLGHSGNAYARAGNKADAQKAIQQLIELSKQKRGTYEVAIIYAGLGEKDRAFEWLERAYQVRDKAMTCLKVDPPLDPLRSDPRFQDLLRRMNFPP
jgi:tetratricopeptide (TPR) repeat protein